MAYQVDLVVDTSALVAILLNEPDGPLYFRRIASTQAALSAVGKVETLMVVLSRAPDEARERFDFTLERLGVRIVGIDDRLAELAIAAFLQFGKGRSPFGQAEFRRLLFLRLSQAVKRALAVQGRRLLTD